MQNPAANSMDQAEVLKGLPVTVRSDLKASRQVYQGEPVYVIHDPITFRTHRLSVFQYRTLAAMHPDRTVGENFDILVNKGEFERDEESVFLSLVTNLNRLSLLVLPVASGARLFEQHQKVRAMQRRGKFLGFLFMQIPLVNPDRFLTRTVGRVSWLFTRTFLGVWMLGMLAAAFVLWQRWAEVFEPFNGILATQNLPFLWLAFVGLKIWHELGHGYACKVFGGYVPAMGTILIAGTPAAFVDATSAWSFPERYKRLIVMCGGMFFESLVFIPCVFLWAFSDSPTIKSCAWQLSVMASLVTVLFNANPLMKFDGYFILSELIGIQNLRPKSDAVIRSRLKATFLGLKPEAAVEEPLSTRIMLFTYGIAATIYKTVLVISIAAVVAIKFPLVGLALAVFHILTSLGVGAIKLFHYLMSSADTAPIRWRARLVALLVFVGLPLVAFLVPMPFGVVAQGVVAAEVEEYVNAAVPGELQKVNVAQGHGIEQDQPILSLENTELTSELDLNTAGLKEARSRWAILQDIDAALAAEQLVKVTELEKRVADLQQRASQLQLVSPTSGQLAMVVPQTQMGRYFEEGSPLAIVVDGRPVLRTWLNEDQLGSIQNEIGGEVSIRIPGRSTQTLTGKIVSVERTAEVKFSEAALTHLGGGSILVNQMTGEPLEPLFQIDIEPQGNVLALSDHGTRVSLKFDRRHESLARWAWKRCTRFVHKLWVG